MSALLHIAAFLVIVFIVGTGNGFRRATLNPGNEPMPAIIGILFSPFWFLILVIAGIFVLGEKFGELDF